MYCAGAFWRRGANIDPLSTVFTAMRGKLFTFGYFPEECSNWQKRTMCVRLSPQLEEGTLGCRDALLRRKWLSFFSEFVEGDANDDQGADGNGPLDVRKRPIFVSGVAWVCVE